MRASEARFRALVSASSDVTYRMSPDWTRMQRLDGRGFLPDSPQPKINWLDEYVFPEDQPGVMAAVREAVESKGVFELQHRVRRIDGSIGWTFSRAVPILDDDGNIEEWLGMAADVTERVEAEHALRASQGETQRQRRLYEAILNNTPDLAYVFDLDHRFIYANEGLLSMWGRTWDEAVGKNCLELGYEPWHAAMHDREIEQVVATKAPIRGEVPFTGTFGRRIYDYIFVPVVGTDGSVVAVAGTTRDITDYRESEDRLALLVDELNHRVKNTLAIVQAIAHQTFRGTAPADARRAFEGRLNALARAHNVLTREHWHSVDLTDIVREETAACPGVRQVSMIGGPSLRLGPRTAVTLSMALHELCTNAIKHGALSTPDGRVSVNWSIEGDSEQRLIVRWVETGGPAVTAPRQRGFGSRMIERALARDLNGRVTLDFRSEGLTCVIDVPLPAAGIADAGR